MSFSAQAPEPGPVEEGAPHRRRGGLVWKIIGISSGSLLILVGLIMLITPGPGWLAIFAGLALLSPHSRWARAILRKLKDTIRRGRKKPTDGQQD